MGRLKCLVRGPDSILDTMGLVPSRRCSALGSGPEPPSEHTDTDPESSASSASSWILRKVLGPSSGKRGWRASPESCQGLREKRWPRNQRSNCRIGRGGRSSPRGVLGTRV